MTGAIGAFHEGIDIADDYGSQIVATAAGVVTFAGYTEVVMVTSLKSITAMAS